MGVLSVLKKTGFYLNYIRTAPVYLAYKSSPQKDKIKMDLDRCRRSSG